MPDIKDDDLDGCDVDMTKEQDNDFEVEPDDEPDDLEDEPQEEEQSA